MVNQGQFHERMYRVAFYGGSDIGKSVSSFCRALGAELARHRDLKIITGGYKGRKSSPKKQTTDWHIVQGILEELEKMPADQSERLETILPDPEEDIADAVRFEAGKVQRLKGKNVRARRFAIISSADVVVTIHGVRATAEIIDLAFALKRPIFPIPFTGGHSSVQWQENRKAIQEWFGIDYKLAEEFESTNLENIKQADLEILAQKSVNLLYNQLRQRCFIIMPFDKAFETLSDKVIDKAVIDQRLSPLRSDREAIIGDVVSALYKAIRESRCVIAVVTGFNPNVMYELGVAHAMNKDVIILCEREQGGSLKTDIPFDIRNHQIIWYSGDLSSEECIRLIGMLGEALKRIV